MEQYHLFIGCAIALLLQSCYKAHPVPVDKKEYVSKKAEVFLEGNQDEIYPWLSFSAHTDNGKPIYLENGTSCLRRFIDWDRGNPYVFKKDDFH